MYPWILLKVCLFTICYFPCTKIANFLLILMTTFHVAEALLSIAIFQKFSFMYLILIHLAYSLHELMIFQAYFKVNTSLMSFNLLSPTPPSSFGLHKSSYLILYSPPFLIKLAHTFSIFSSDASGNWMVYNKKLTLAWIILCIDSIRPANDKSLNSNLRVYLLF